MTFSTLDSINVILLLGLYLFKSLAILILGLQSTPITFLNLSCEENYKFQYHNISLTIVHYFRKKLILSLLNINSASE